MGGWTEDRVEALKRRFQAGDSFAVIARALGGGISRSACIGKATRMGLKRARDRGEFHRIASKIATAKAQGRAGGGLRAPAVPRAVAQNNGLNFQGPRIRPAGLKALAGFDGEGRVAMADLEPHHCRWPFGDPDAGTFRFCGARQAKGAYCAEHAARAYLPLPEDQGADWLVRLFGRLA